MSTNAMQGVLVFNQNVQAIVHALNNLHAMINVNLLTCRFVGMYLDKKKFRLLFEIYIFI